MRRIFRKKRNLFRSILLFLFFFLILFNCAQSRLVLEGRILSSAEDGLGESEILISGAKIEWMSESQELISTQYSDAQGNYNLEMTFPEDQDKEEVELKFLLRVSKFGYKTTSVYILGGFDFSTKTDIYLEKED